MSINWVGDPAGWLTFLLPAMATAIVVRWDAVKIGPYFALSDLISAMPPTQARMFYEDTVLRRALYRRFVYPFLLGVVLGGTTDMAMTDVTAVGVVTALLLVWPVVFQGLPWYVPTRTWHLPALYVSFLIAYGALTLSGALVSSLFLRVTRGEIVDWVTNELLANGIVWLVGLFAVSVFGAARRRTNDEANRRHELGGEKLSGHDLGDA